MHVTLRGLHRDDIPAWNRLLADVEQVENSGEHYNEADLVEEMENPDVEVGKDLVGAFEGTEMIGYFGVLSRTASDVGHKIHLEGSVHPRHRGQGVGTRLVEAMMSRAEEVHRAQHPDVPVLYLLSGASDNVEQQDLVGSFGLEPDRWSFVMRADLADVAPPSPLPQGFELRRYDDTMADSLFEAHNEAFLDHPNFAVWTEVEWKQRVLESRSFRPQLSYVVLDTARPTDSAHASGGGRIAAYVQTSEYDAYEEMTGRREAYVAKVGTRREYRGRGLASTMLQHCLSAYGEAGYDEASLDVDSENPTGALGVYTRAGFTVESRRTDYAKRVG
ncbi:MAG: GNAT family N-acetyltransferase [Actinomycetota bacterium]|nr:GNAT family N-acetyltransferase [Actinomycetota bacterium]